VTFGLSLKMIVSSSIHFPENDIISLFIGWINTPLCIYIPHFLYPFIDWWAFRLISQLG
jgi:hypothetical protein